MLLLKSQLNQIYSYLEVSGLIPNNFSVTTEVVGGRFLTSGSSIRYNSENYFFNCGSQDGQFYIYYSPSKDLMVEETIVIGWDNVIYHIKIWVSSLLLEISQPDKWRMLNESINTANIRVADSKEKFSYQEVLEVGNRINALKGHIAEIPLTFEQSLLINEKLDHLTELAKSANKFDWGSFFIGNIMSIIITLSVTPENAKLVWDAIKHIFSNYILLS